MSSPSYKYAKISRDTIWFLIETRLEMIFFLLLANTMHDATSVTVLPTIPFALGMGPGVRSVYRNIWATFYALSLIPENPELRWEMPSKALLILGCARSKINLGSLAIFRSK